jgi:hypothetical protein
LLALFDTNAVGTTYGMGDRFYWSWKLIDFANGTFQGAANGLARLLTHGLLPTTISETSILRRIDSMFYAAGQMRRKNGSMEEAFPYESSFCVTALVAYDLLTAVELLSNKIEATQREDYLKVVDPMIRFLLTAEEKHAFISNHLATAAAAMFKWHALTGEAGNSRGQVLVERILQCQSTEGWFKEYEGADPGYQTLCMYYLADIYESQPKIDLLGPLSRAVQFLWHFAHPDGSFGGMYGSRNTRFYYPAGIERLANDIKEAAALALFMRNSIANDSTVTLNAIDEPNLIPMFNAYCWAAAMNHETNVVENQKDLPELPALSNSTFQKQYGKTGIILDKGPTHYTVLSTHKGGLCYHYRNGIEDRIDTGVVIKEGGDIFSTQAYQTNNNFEFKDKKIVVKTHFTKVRNRTPAPYQFIVLRILNLTLMRNYIFSIWIKQMLVKYLITGKNRSEKLNIRTINLGPNLTIEDEQHGGGRNYVCLEPNKHFSAIHMASQGYWQIQDDVDRNS